MQDTTNWSPGQRLLTAVFALTEPPDIGNNEDAIWNIVYARLKPMWAEVLALLYGRIPYRSDELRERYTYHYRSLAEVGFQLNRTRERIRAIEASALIKLRQRHGLLTVLMRSQKGVYPWSIQEQIKGGV